jgi:hypothetical protein
MKFSQICTLLAILAIAGQGYAGITRRSLPANMEQKIIDFVENIPNKILDLMDDKEKIIEMGQQGLEAVMSYYSTQFANPTHVTEALTWLKQHEVKAKLDVQKKVEIAEKKLAEAERKEEALHNPMDTVIREAQKAVENIKTIFANLKDDENPMPTWAILESSRGFLDLTTKHLIDTVHDTQKQLK